MQEGVQVRFSYKINEGKSIRRAPIVFPSTTAVKIKEEIVKKCFGSLDAVVGDTFAKESLIKVVSSVVTRSTSLTAGSLSPPISFLATTSKAWPGVNSPILTPGGSVGNF